MISLVVGNQTLSGFVDIEVVAKYKEIPNYFTCCFRYEDIILFKINDKYKLYIDDVIYQQGVITDIELSVSKKENGRLYFVRGVDKNNYLINNSCGLYTYLDIYEEIPSSVKATRILDSFKIKYSMEVPDVGLFIQPNTTDSLWSVVKKVANYTNSNAVSNGNILRFINKPDNKLRGFLINDSINSSENNIFDASLKLQFSSAVKNINVVNNLTDKQTQTNNNIDNGNENSFERDFLFIEDLENFNKYLRENNNYDIIKYCCILKTHSINNTIPMINNLVDVFDDKYNIDSSLLIIGLCFKESRKHGVQLFLELVDPSVINAKTSKGNIGNKFIDI